MPDNFNYLSFGNRAYVTAANGPIEMHRGRMFEYTPTELEKRLEALSTASVAYLESLPTFVCSEIGGGEGASMLVKYGSISQTAPGQKEVTTHFTPLIDFGEIEFESNDAASAVFGADRFQVYRTHWAVREGDAGQVLARLAVYKPGLAEAVAALAGNEPGSPPAEPPPRAKVVLGEANCLQDFLQLLYAVPADADAEMFFRGHQDASFELTPSLLRKDPNGDWQFMPREDRLCKELLIAHYDEFQGDHYSFDRLVRMQHFGLPTRLLDITSNPLVALYFACEGPPELAESEGEVIVFRMLAEEVKYYDSDSVSCLANLSNLSYAQKNDIDLSLEHNDFNASEVIQKLLHHIKFEKSFFEDRIVPDHLGSIICVKAKRTNTRIRSQSGAFLLFGHEAALPDAGLENIAITRIAIRNKTRILRELDRVHINATTVYPSIEQTAQHLRAQYRPPGHVAGLD